MTPGEVIALFGEESIYEDWMGGNLNDSLLYRGLIFGFDRCDGSGPLEDSALDELLIRQRDDVFLFEKPMMAWTKTDLLRRFTEECIRIEGKHFVQNANRMNIPDLQMVLEFDDDGQLSELDTWQAPSAEQLRLRTSFRE